MIILYLIPEITNTGPSNVVLNLLKEYSDTKLYESIYVVTVRESVKNEYYYTFKSFCFNPIIVLNDKRSLALPRLRAELKKILSAKTKISNLVCHSHGFIPDLLLSSINMKSLFKVNTVHCIFHKDYSQEYGLKGSLMAFIHYFSLTFGRFSSIIGCSQAVENNLKKYVYFRYITYINNGCSTKDYYPISLEDQKKLKISLKIDLKKTIFLYCGRIIRRKRVPELIKFFINSNFENSILIILGEGPEIDICKTNSFNDDRIIYRGFVDKPSEYYKISNFIISNSSAEGYPLSIIEALLCGCNAILSEIPPHEDLKNKFPELVYSLNEFNSSVSTSNVIDVNSDLNELSSKRMADQYFDTYKKNID